MKVKERLESHIRGWFPKEPKVSVVPAKTDSRTNERPPLTKQMKKGTSATGFLKFNTIFVVVLGSLFIIQINVQSHISLAPQVTWITAGLTIGSIISISFTKWQLNCLIRDTEIRTTIAGSLFIAGAMLIFASILIGVASTNLLIGIGFVTSVFAAVPAFGVVRYVLFLSWEKKNKLRILQNRSRFFIVPRSDANSTVDTGEVFGKS